MSMFFTFGVARLFVKCVQVTDLKEEWHWFVLSTRDVIISMFITKGVLSRGNVEQVLTTRGLIKKEIKLRGGPVGSNDITDMIFDSTKKACPNSSVLHDCSWLFDRQEATN